MGIPEWIACLLRDASTLVGRRNLPLAVVVALAAVLRFGFLGRQSYWYDEAVTVEVLHKSFLGMLGALPHSESTPPLYYVIAWPWSRLFGLREFGLRSLSAVLGTATMPVSSRGERCRSIVLIE